MKNVKFTSIMLGVVAASLIMGVSMGADAGCEKGSRNKSSYDKSGPKKSFFQCLYDTCKGCSKKTKAKTSCGKK